MSQGSSSPSIDLKRVKGNAIATGAGAVDAGTLRVQLSTESLSALENISITVPGTVDIGTVSLEALEVIKVTNDTGTSLAINDNSGSLTVDGTVSVTDGGGSITVDGTFWQATQPVSAASLPLPSGAATEAKQDTQITSLQLLDDTVATDGSTAVTKLFQVGGTDGTNAQILSVTSGGALNIADGGGAITVDGTVGISGSVAVTGPLTDTQLRASAVPVSLASVPSHAVTNAGTFAVQESGAALTALQLLDDTVATDGLTALTKLYQVGGTDGTNAQILAVDNTGAVKLAAGSNSIGTVELGSTSLAALETISISGSVAVTGTFWQNTQPVSLASSVAVTDNSGSLTVDAPVGTPVYVRLSNGSGAVDTLPVSFTAAAKTNASTTAYANSLVIKAAAGTLYMLNGYNSNTSDQFIQLFDSATLPANATAPKLTFYAPAESNFYFDFGFYGRAFASGIVVCNSSTGATKTIGSADCWFDAQFA